VRLEEVVVLVLEVEVLLLLLLLLEVEVDVGMLLEVLLVVLFATQKSPSKTLAVLTLM
jgi:hypothetical protein